MIALIAGIALVLATAWSVFTALVVPRVTSSPAMRMLARSLGGSVGERRQLPRVDLVPLAGLDPQLADRSGGHDGLGGALSRSERVADTAPGSPLPVHGDQLPALHGPRVAHPYDDDPLPTGSVRLSRQEFDEGFARLESVNFPAERNVDAWRNFTGWRVTYEPIVDALTALIVPPPAPWFIARPALGMAKFPLVLNRTPDEPEGAQGLGVNKTFKTPSARESNNS